MANCQRPPEKPAVLAATVREVATPLHAAVAPASAALAADVTTLGASPSAATLERARASWREAARTWREAYAFREGPAVETSALVRTTYWPPNPKLVQRLLDGDGPLDRPHIDVLGVDAKGLFALEALLFAAGTPAEAAAAFVAHPRRGVVARALAEDINRYGQLVAGRLATSGAAFAERYGGAGQASVNRLVNQMIQTIEGVCIHHLDLVLGLDASKMLRQSEVEGWPSGTSQALALAPLVATERLYLGGPGGGLSALARHASREQDERVRAAFSKAINEVRGLGAPLETVVRDRRAALVSAAAATRALEIAIKTDLANALGVTLTFVSGDGD